MVIGITIDHVLRDILSSIQYRYMQVFSDSGSIKLPITNENFFEFFKFPDKEAYDKFINEDYCLEIFGFSDLPEKKTILALNVLYYNLKKHGHDLIIIAFNDGRAKPATLHFLSTMICPADTICFLKNKSDVWGICDVVITAEGEVIKSKPFWKKAVKIARDFNKNIKTYNTTTFKELSEIQHMEFMSKLFLTERIKNLIYKIYFKFFS